MKNKEFFYLQYNKINWENQEKTKINYKINDFIIQNIIKKKKEDKIKIFDIGCGIGVFIKMLCEKLTKNYKEITIEACEPSEKNYNFYINKKMPLKKNIKLKIYKKDFINVKTPTKFDFITAIYVFPHFLSRNLEKIIKKINSMLNKEGRCIIVVANERYLSKKLKTMKNLFIEKNVLHLGGKNYKEVLHYSDIPKIGKIIDYNREEVFYIDLFKRYNFKLKQKINLNDKGFICTIFDFQKIK